MYKCVCVFLLFYIKYHGYRLFMQNSTEFCIRHGNGSWKGKVIIKMEDRIKKRGNQLIVYVPKELDHHFAEQITEQVDKELERGLIKQLVFDFSETGFMDSSGIGMIMGRKRILSYSKGTVVAIHVSDRVLKIMQLSGIYKHIEISQEPVWNYKVR